MGMTTYLYGVIQEYGLNTGRLMEVYDHNEKVISELPLVAPWPPLTSNMFAITKNPHLEGGRVHQYWGRMIHFATCTKSIEYEWSEWKEKFEALLLNLYWLEAQVHFVTEYTDTISFQWRVDLKKWNLNEDPIVPMKKTDWDFTDVNGWEEMGIG